MALNKEISSYHILLVFFAASIILLALIFSEFSFEGDKNINEDESYRFLLEANSSNLEYVEFETEYMSVDGMNELESPSISVDSEECLRFVNYDGSVNFGETVNIEGQAEGVSTCSMNVTKEFSVEETVEADRVSPREMKGVDKIVFNAESVEVEIIGSDEEYSFKEDVGVEMRAFNGSMAWEPNKENYHATGIVYIDGEKLE